MPVAVVLDWLLRPPARQLSIRTTVAYLVFPAVYTVYSLARGPLTGFYPYPFFDPAQAGGYGRDAGFLRRMSTGSPHISG